MTTYIVIAVAWGDGSGEAYPGRRIWSERFKTHAAADFAAKFLRSAGSDDLSVTIIKDGE